MTGLRVAPRWLSTALGVALIVAMTLALSAVYSARGSSHDGELYACLFAGSLSQVGPNEPANCGRGSVVVVNGGEVEATAPTSIVRTGVVLGNGGTGRDAEITGDGTAGYTITYPVGVFDPDGDMPVLTVMPLFAQPTPVLISHSWVDGVLEVGLVTGGQASIFHFSVVQNVPAPIAP